MMRYLGSPMPQWPQCAAPKRAVVASALPGQGIGGYVSGEGPRSSEGTQNWLSVTPPGPQGHAARSAVGLLTDWELVPQVAWASIYSGEGI